ncbi:unnamed protein product, partial [marine sediment metagenome]
MSDTQTMLTRISDADLKAAYISRFRVPVGMTFNNSKHVAE